MKRALPVVAVKELVATVRTGLWPLSRLRALPLPHPRPTRRRPPVVLVHGFLGHQDCLRNLARHLLRAGVPEVVRVAYPSRASGLEDIVARIAQAARPLGTVDLVGHSLGALACRAWLKTGDGAPYTRRFVSLGGPHAGSPWWRFTPAALHDALQPGGVWADRLAQGPEPVPTTVIRARYDHQVFPPSATTLPNAHTVIIDGVGHNGLLWSPDARRAVLEALSRP